MKNEKYKLADLIDLKKLQSLINYFYKATGFTSAVLDLNGNILITSPWREICILFHRTHPETQKRHMENMALLTGTLAQGEKYSISECGNGLIHAASSIIVEGRHVGNWFTGQCLLAKPDVEYFRRQAKEFGFYEEDYLQALQKVPITSEAQIRQTLEFLSELAGVLGEMNVIQKRQLEVTNDLRLSKEWFAAVANYTYDWETWVDPQGHLVWTNPAVERVTGYTVYECMAMEDYPLPLIYKDDLKLVDSMFKDAVAGCEANDLFFRIQNKDGSIRWVAISWQQIYDSQGKSLGHRASVRDIDERKKLAETEIKKLTLFPTENPDPIFNVLKDGTVDFSNKAAKLILDQLGYKFGQRVPDVFWEKASSVFSSKKTENFEIKIDEKVFIFKFVPILDFQYANVYGRDITDRQKAEEERLRLESELSQVQKMEAIGQLAGGIAHDFNNILTAIQGNAELLNINIDSDSEDSNFVKQIIRASQRATDLTKQLLGFARKGQFQIIPVDAHKIIDDVILLLSRSIDKRIEIKKELKAEPSIIAGDPSQLENAILNLGLNARDAMPEGGSLTFSTRTTVLDQTFCQKHPYEIVPGKYMEICVTDTGIGMSKKIQSRIFEPFFTTKPQDEGTGLGLAGVYGCVKSHNGSIQVYSEPGHGTTFKIYLPLGEELSTCVEETTNDIPIKGQGQHILVVDDEQSVREFTGNALKSLGYRTKICQDGIEAINYVKEHPDDIDLVILDLIMPKLSGEDTFRSLREINPGIKVLISSGFSQHDKTNTLLKNGAVGFLNKPFRLDELSQKVARYIC